MSTFLTERFDEAMVYTSQLHRNQKRKGTQIPYVSHLLGVASLVIEAGGDEDEAIAALLHDGPEDQGGIKTLETIRELFGEQVATIVSECSDTLKEDKPPWQARKEAYISHLETVSASTLLVSCADKLQNARAILSDYRINGETLWTRFNGGRDGTLWYYRALVTKYREVIIHHPLVDTLDRVVTELEETANKIC